VFVYGTYIIYICVSGQATAIPGITIFRSSAMIYYANAELYQEALLKKVPHTTDELHTGSTTTIEHIEHNFILKHPNISTRLEQQTLHFG